MPARKGDARRKDKGRKRARQVSLKPAGEVVVRQEEVPPRPPEDKRIHRRRPLPLISEGPPGDADKERSPSGPAGSQ